MLVDYRVNQTMMGENTYSLFFEARDDGTRDLIMETQIPLGDPLYEHVRIRIQGLINELQKLLDTHTRALAQS